MKCVGIIDDSVSFLVGGEAGQGITRSGSLIGKALMRGGFHVFGTNDYPSLIRGGHNFYVLRASEREVTSQLATVDVVIALNKESALLHEAELNEGGGIVADEKVEFKEGELRRDDVGLYPVPLTDIVKELEGPDIMRNTVALGAAMALVGYGPDILKEVIAETFAEREKVAEMNRKAVDRGYEFAKDGYGDGFPCRLEAGEGRGEIMLTGDDAVALGAIQAGCKYYAAYPMTPASPLLHYMAAHDVEVDMTVIQTESEIAAICMAVGAGYSGLRAMTATSGGGFCLMSEGLGMAAMTETPVVLMVGQRPGPSTGLATYSSQGDLLFTIHASQGEFQRVVVAPGDVDECFYETMRAFNLAERFQVPVIILTDKYLVESHKSTAPFDGGRVPIDRGELLYEWTGEGDYERYKITDNGVSPRLVLGAEGATILANSNEHLEYGYTTSDPEPTKAMVDKRFRKKRHIEEAVSGLDPVRTYGEEDARVTLVGWGSTKGPALEALRMLEKEGVKARFAQVVYLDPFPKEAVGGVLKGGGDFVLFENNRTAQLGELIRLHNGYTFEHVGLKYDGRPFNPGEMVEKVREVLA